MNPKNRYALFLLSAALLFSLPAGAQGRRRRRLPVRPPKKAASPSAAKKAPKKAHEYLAVIDAVIHTGTGDVLPRSTLLVKDGKVEKLGPNVEIPKGAKVVDAKGRHVCPGVIALNLGRLGVGFPRGSVRDYLRPFDIRIKFGLAAGITASAGGTRGGGSGRNWVIKLTWGDPDKMLVAENTVVGFSTSDFAGSRLRRTRKLLEAWRSWRASWQAYLESVKSGNRKAAPPKPSKQIEGLARVFRGEAVLWIDRVTTLAQVKRALWFLKQVNLPAVLYGTAEGWILAPELGRAGCMAVVYPRYLVERNKDLLRKSGSGIRTPFLLSKAGVPVACLPSPRGFGAGGLGIGGILGRDMNTPFVPPAYAVRGGMAPEEALQTVTRNPARMIGLAYRLGTLEPGKDADFLLLTGPPLHYRTLVDRTYINGRLYYDRAKEPLLRNARK